MTNLQRTLCALCLLLLCFSLIVPATPLYAQANNTPAEAAALSILNSYPPDPSEDIAWGAGFGGLSDVIMAFNLARQRENELLGLTLGELVAPSSQSWEAMSSAERALWLVNEERTARGLAPLQGLEQNVTDVAQSYAEWLLANNQFDHDADGRSPWERLEDNSAIDACHDFLEIAENLYFTASTGNDPLPLVIEQAVYVMLYEDAGSQWGHRHALLWTPYDENSGAPDREGFLGVGMAHGGYTNPYDGRYYQNTHMVVMNLFDPCATWTDANPITPEPSPTPSATPSPTPSATPSPTASPTPSPTASPTPPQTGERSVTGRITTPDGTPLIGVTIAAEEGASTLTDGDGRFILAGLTAQSHLLIPSKAGYSFNPSTIMVDLTTEDRNDITFTGSDGPGGSELTFSLHLPLILPD